MEKEFATFYMARHGETEANIADLVHGHSSSALTEKGVAQAQALGEKLKDVHFDAVFSSDLVRAKHTAEIAKLERDLAVETTELLRERFFGEFENKKVHLLEEHVRQMLETLQHLTYSERRKRSLGKGMESDEGAVNRLLLFFREAAVAYAGKTVLIVSHGSVIRAFLLHIGYGTPETLRSGAVENAGYVKFKSDGVDFVVESVDGIKKSGESESV